ncbi:MAG: YbhB/YbcL family Raf kinase inhibitor-like protein [Phycisphaeraceae bacterium]
MPPSEPQSSPKGGLQLCLSAFGQGQPIPRKFTGDGEDVSPQITWSAPSERTHSLALICDDPDAPTEKPWVHWLIWNIPAAMRKLEEGVPRMQQPAGLKDVRQGRNDFPSDSIGYRGPAPPKGHGVHHYHFKLYALDARLDVPAGAKREELEAAMKGHVLAQAQWVGTYERK